MPGATRHMTPGSIHQMTLTMGGGIVTGSIHQMTRTTEGGIAIVMFLLVSLQGQEGDQGGATHPASLPGPGGVTRGATHPVFRPGLGGHLGGVTPPTPLVLRPGLGGPPGVFTPLVFHLNQKRRGQGRVTPEVYLLDAGAQGLTGNRLGEAT